MLDVNETAKFGKAGISIREKSRWISTPTANLVRYEPSGTYYARLRVDGKLKWHSLKTDVYTVATERLSDFVEEQRQGIEREREIVAGKMTFNDALDIYRQRLFHSSLVGWVTKMAARSR